MPIFKGIENIESIYKGDIAIDSIYKGEDLVYENYKIVTKEGEPPLTVKTAGENLIEYTLYGKTVQNGTPTPTSPVPIQSVGDLVDNPSDPNYGKYKIPVTVSQGSDSITTNIYLNNPLRRIVDGSNIYSDYIDSATGKVYRRIGVYVFDSTHYSFSLTTVNNVRYYYRIISDVTIPVTSPFVTHYEGTRSFYQGMSNLRATVNGGAYRSLYIRDDRYTTAADFNDSIKELADNGTPMILNYVLAPSYATQETVTLPTIPSIKGQCTYTIGSSINASNMYIKYKGKQS